MNARSPLLFLLGLVGLLFAANALAVQPAPDYGSPQVRVFVKAGTDLGPLVRALDPHFKCLEVIPDGITGRGDMLQDCDPDEPNPNAFRVHAH